MKDECARIVNADYLVTCNLKDFKVVKSGDLHTDQHGETGDTGEGVFCVIWNRYGRTASGNQSVDG